jgi:uncharacterized protein (TIGR02145 family)
VRFFRSLLLTATTCLTLFPSAGEAASLSGRVIDGRMAGVPDVTVRLARFGGHAVTDAQGNWVIQAEVTGMKANHKRQMVSGNLFLDGGRLGVHFSGYDLLGREAITRSIGEQRGTGSAARVRQADPDTLLFSKNGRVFLRDTVSVFDRPAIVRTLDSFANPALVYGHFMDGRDGRVYRTRKIGDDEWMAQNLHALADSSWEYGNNPDSASKYGRLYSWTAAMGLGDSCSTRSCSTLVTTKHKGICPTGWHVPTSLEWNRLIDTMGGVQNAGAAAKTLQGWWPYGGISGNGSDEFGFGSKPSGRRTVNASSSLAGMMTFYLSAQEFDATQAWSRRTHFQLPFFETIAASKLEALSVRCAKD